METQVNIDIQIDVLQVERAGQVDAVSLQREIERELSALIILRGVPSHWRESHSIADIAAEGNETESGGQDDALAANIAAAVYEALGR